jgi:transposase
MPWKGPQIANERERFVIRADCGTERFATLCRNFGISRVTGYRWLNRYRHVGNVRELTELSRRPHRVREKIKATTIGKSIAQPENTPLPPSCLSSSNDRNARRDAQPRSEEFNCLAWMVRLLLDGDIPRLLAKECPGRRDLSELSQLIVKGRPQERARVMSVMARFKGIPAHTVADALQIHPRTVQSYFRRYAERGIAGLYSRRKPRCKDVEGDKRRLFALLHSPPSAYGINRTSWKMDDLHQALVTIGHRMSHGRIRRLIKATGFRWRKAKAVLTSNDPDYHAKVASIVRILSTLQKDEAFFSVDEFGPFAVRQVGGRKRVARNERYFVPQWQRAKGWLIITAALELSTNQVTHFYSLKKNTDEMIKMADQLRNQYRHCSAIYLSWDAASWHISRRLSSHLEETNKRAEIDGCPVIRTAPLPVGSQFLNVIESVFSGMARAIIHNSDYSSVECAKGAIDRHFEDRNAHFAEHPKRAGSKVWGNELVPSEFREGQNCKDPRF